MSIYNDLVGPVDEQVMSMEKELDALKAKRATLEREDVQNILVHLEDRYGSGNIFASWEYGKFYMYVAHADLLDNLGTRDIKVSVRKSTLTSVSNGAYVDLIFRKSMGDMIIVIPGYKRESRIARGQWNYASNSKQSYEENLLAALDKFKEDAMHAWAQFATEGSIDSLIDRICQRRSLAIVEPFKLNRELCNQII